VEKTIPRCFIKKDLWGFIDILCIGDQGIMGVQTTTGSNFANRVSKIKSHKNYDLVNNAKIIIMAHGWRKIKAKCKNGSNKEKWECRELNLNS
jgi:hypothetical protein